MGTILIKTYFEIVNGLIVNDQGLLHENMFNVRINVNVFDVILNMIHQPLAVLRKKGK